MGNLSLTPKQQVQYNQWATTIKACAESGMTVRDWCSANNINVSSYYYHLKRVREIALDDALRLQSKENTLTPISSKFVKLDPQMLNVPDTSNAITFYGKNFYFNVDLDTDDVLLRKVLGALK